MSVSVIIALLVPC